MRKITTTAAATLAAAAVIASGAAATPGAETEHFSLLNISTHESHLYSTIATGAFTAGGTAIVTNGGADVTMRFPNGTIKLDVKPGHVRTATNPSCLLREAASGSYTIVSGTGAYKSISGSGKVTATATFVGAMVGGKCSNNTPATAIQIIDTGTGPVSLP